MTNRPTKTPITWRVVLAVIAIFAAVWAAFLIAGYIQHSPASDGVAFRTGWR